MVKSQLHPKVLKLKSSDIIWTGVVHTKFQLIWPRNEEVQMGAPTEPHHYFREKTRVGWWFGGQKSTSPKGSET